MTPLLRFSLAILLFAPGVLRAQTAGTAPPHVASVDGRVTLVRDAVAEPLDEGLPLVYGDRLETAAGRVEILLGGHGTIDLDHDSQFELLSASLARLFAGRVRLLVDGAQDSYRIDTPAGSVETETAGEYVVAFADHRMSVAVVRGAALVSNGAGAIRVHAGELTTVRPDELPAVPARFNSALADEFDRWSQDRRRARVGYASPPYLPASLQPYAGTLDRHGTWAHDVSYGYVWQPSVAGGWKPYWNGGWRYIGRFGWTWVGLDRWAWPTHHYGRWVFLPQLGWAWVPGAQWGPAWVSWATGPGYVAWCPLGGGRPVAGAAGFTRRSLYDASGIYEARGIYDANGIDDPRTIWTAAPAHAFSRRTVTVHSVVRVMATARPSLASRPGLPSRAAIIEPRSIPLKSPIGSRALSPASGARPPEVRRPIEPPAWRSPDRYPRSAVPRPAAPVAIAPPGVGITSMPRRAAPRALLPGPVTESMRGAASAREAAGVTGGPRGIAIPRTAAVRGPLAPRTPGGPAAPVASPPPFAPHTPRSPAPPR